MTTILQYRYIENEAFIGEGQLSMMRWGLVPAKIADPYSFKIFTTTNARAESILDKPIWKGPFQHTRCLVPIDGFYEWLQRPSLPQPPPIRWLNDYDESRPPLDLLRPYESEGMRMTPANRAVGNVRNNGPEMLNSA